MSGISLTEYDPAAPRQQLHALLKTPDGFVAELRDHLERLCPGVTVSHDPARGLLLVAFPEAGERAGFLRVLVKVLDVYVGAPPGAVPELLETRLVAVAAKEGGRPPFSRCLRMADEAALPGDHRPSLRLAHGTSFGSGRHPSTRLAMNALDRLAGSETVFPARVLDVGCGSGILALACGLLGAREVLGIDIDGEALALATGNAEANGLGGRVCFSPRPLAELTGVYDLLVANVSGAVMSGMVGEFARLVRSGGWLVVSGLQGRQLDEMEEVLGGLGFAEGERFSEGAWRAGLLQSGGPGSV